MVTHYLIYLASPNTELVQPDRVVHLLDDGRGADYDDARATEAQPRRSITDVGV